MILISTVKYNAAVAVVVIATSTQTHNAHLFECENVDASEVGEN